jgi:3-oxoacyl-[acyl-carrier-protein] synthase I
MKNDTAPSDRIVITAIGLTTSLGLDTARSLAAIRGVVANFSEHETVMVNGDAHGTELSGAKIARLPENALSRQVCGAHRAAALLKPALEECLEGLPETLLSNTRLRWSTRAEMINDDFPAALQNLLENWEGFELLQTEPVVGGLGRCQFFEDVIEAMADLRAGTCQGVLVACVDSLCDTPHLEQLFEEGRPKSGSDPEGIVAGEGAGAFLLELESRAKERNAPVYAYLHAGGKGFESTEGRGSAPANGKDLSKAFREAFSQLSGGGTEIDMVLVDLNGEGARAYEWGCTEGRIFSASDTPPELKHPADCTGDCGMAMGAVLVGAAAGFMSGTLAVRHVALSTADEKGARRVLCLEKGPSLIHEAESGRNRENPPPPFLMVIDQHCDEAAFLWQIRRHLTKAPHFSLQDLARHDERLEAHLEGLRLSGETGWDLCQRNLERQWAEELFAPALLAFESGHKSRIRKVVKAARSDREAARALVSALGWMSYEKAEPHIQRFFDSECSFDRYLGIAAGALHRQIPATVLDKAVVDPDPLVKERAWKAVGELGRGKEFDMDRLLADRQPCSEERLFYAIWSAALAGNPYAVNLLKN